MATSINRTLPDRVPFVSVDKATAPGSGACSKESGENLASDTWHRNLGGNWRQDRTRLANRILSVVLNEIGCVMQNSYMFAYRIHSQGECVRVDDSAQTLFSEVKIGSVSAVLAYGTTQTCNDQYMDGRPLAEIIGMLVKVNTLDRNCS